MSNLLKTDEEVLNNKLNKLKSKKYIYEILKKTSTILIILYIVFNYIFGLSKMTGMQMNPKISDGDLIIFYRIQKKYVVGDVVTFKQNNKRYTLRIVAMEGQNVDISDDGELIVDKHALEEEVYYNTNEIKESDIKFPYKVENGKVFLLGDYRIDSVDSRKFGTISLNQLDGKVIGLMRNRSF